ncbi:MAG TPA: DUF5318 family protein [Nonomuraea sp.]|uniref:DUF5318 family protein n=1 Tax=Nonomuraea sp. NPDC049649 TaxID=3155776 RepID=UPI002CE67A03|nr:DUF5318 family protein [Nonomuraea sp.]
MWSLRQVVDDGRAERSVLHAARAGRTPPDGAYRLCPRCGRENATGPIDEYGGAPGRHADQAKVASEPIEMAHDYDEYRVYAGEVCQGCSWNHLTVSFVLGNGPPVLAGRA